MYTIRDFLASELPDGALPIVEGGAHMSMLWPNAFNAAIERFLGDLDR